MSTFGEILTRKMKNNLFSHFKLAGLAFAILILATGCSTTNKPENQKTSEMTNTNTNASMGTAITLGGKTVHTVGKLPAVGTELKSFTLTDVDLNEKTLAGF